MRRGRQEAPHCQQKDRQTKDRADPEATRHVAELFVLFFGAGHDILRLQGHSANRAVARMILLDLGMHRTGVNGFLWLLNNRVPLQCHATLRAGSRTVALDLFTHGAEVLTLFASLHSGYLFGWSHRESSRCDLELRAKFQAIQRRFLSRLPAAFRLTFDDHAFWGQAREFPQPVTRLSPADADTSPGLRNL